jgi:hypothetical protein
MIVEIEKTTIEHPTRKEAVNFALAEAVRRIERLEGNDLYRRAWARAALLIKNMMVEFNTPIIATPEQISSNSSRPVA